MSEFNNLLELQMMMCLLMAVGALFRKINLITKEGKSVLTDLIIYYLLPCSIIRSFWVEFDSTIISAGLTVFLMSVGIQVGCSLVSAFCYNSIQKEQRVIMQYGTICSNAGILGNPLAEGLYGPLGLLYASIYTIPQRIAMWSEGVSFFTESPDKLTLVKKVVTHPCVIACMIGIVMMLSGIRFPGFVSRAVDASADCLTAVSMIFVGTVLYEAGLKNVISVLSLLYSAIRLFIIPLITMAVCMVIGTDKLAGSVCVILAAMPAGNTTAIMAAKYGGDEEFATQLVLLTTVLSMVLLPVWSLVLDKVL